MREAKTQLAERVPKTQLEKSEKALRAQEIEIAKLQKVLQKAETELTARVPVTELEKLKKTLIAKNEEIKRLSSFSPKTKKEGGAQTSKSIQKFRSTPLTDLSGDAVKNMLKDKGFFDSRWNISAKGFDNDYQLQKDGLVVVDRNSGLMWQQSGSANGMNFENAKNYVKKLNREKFAGYGDWRLPTLEEAMSLIEPETKQGKLYIDPVFDNSQLWIWTADRNSASRAWLVLFDGGDCDWIHVDSINNSVRAVRS